MAYKICTFDSSGRIIAVSPNLVDAYYPSAPIEALLNAKQYSPIEESDITSDVVDNMDDEYNGGINLQDSTDGAVTFRGGTAGFDPRVEVTLFMPNPSPYISFGDRIFQDITKVVTIYNVNDSTTKPVHSETVKKFGPSSCKFTRSGSGLTGGSLLVSNISKNNYSGVTAPHNDVARTALSSYSMELFFYPTSLSHNFTLLQKGPTGASANWKLGFDSSAGFLQFAWQSYGKTAGYNYSQNIVAVAGISLNAWNHVAVAAVRNTGTAGTISYLLSGYFNGSNVFSVGVTSGSFPETRYSEGIYIGNNHLGTDGFAGYMDAVRVLESVGQTGNTAGLFGPSGYGFLPYGGGTLGVPTASGFTRNNETAFFLSFNAPAGFSAFFGESKDYIAGTVCRITNLTLGVSGISPATSAEVGVRDVARYTVGYTAGATGLYADPTGFTTAYGSIFKPFTTTQLPGSSGYLHGYDYPYQLNGVYDNNPSLNVYRYNQRNSVSFDLGLSLLYTIDGASGNRGSCGSEMASAYGTNPFVRLFSNGSGNCYGVSLAHNSLSIDPTNSSVMNYIMESGYLASQGITKSSYSFVDAIGKTRYLSATDIQNLRLDLLAHKQRLYDRAKETLASMDAATTKNEISKAKYTKTSPTLSVIGNDELVLDGPKGSL